MVEISSLEAEYCPPLDSSLLFAIVSDYDLSQQDNVRELRSILDPLKADALIEDDATFDPSGTSGAGHASWSKENSSTSNGNTATTDDTSISQDLQSLHLSDGGHSDIDLDALDENTKIALLIDVIGDQVSDEEIKSTLEACGGNWHAAMDELFTQAYFKTHGEQVVAKGVDGFASGDGRVSRKTKRRHNARSRASSADSYTSNDSSTEYTPSKWVVTKTDIDFIAAHTGQTTAAVRLVYNQQGASRPKTIATLLKQEITAYGIQQDKDETVALAKELSEDFPTIAAPYVLSIIRMTSPSSVKAHELARALVARPVSKGRSGGITPQYIRVTDNDLNGDDWRKVPKKTMPISTSASPVSYASLRAHAFTQASASYRKAKSNPLYGGAAAYYSEVGRDYSARSQAANAAAADELANAQSSSTQVDLHGVDVLNGVRIAQQKVEQWWMGLGENRANGRVGALKRNECFHIVVGLGRHSEGGKGKLGPAVTKMLRSEGWRFENEGAVIAVSGRLKT